MMEFLDLLMELILYFLECVTIDDIIISTPLVFVIFSLLFLTFRKVVGIR